MNLLPRLAQCFLDGRNPVLVKHEVSQMLAQRVYGLALGYEDYDRTHTMSSPPAGQGLDWRTDLYYLAPANRGPFDALHRRLAASSIRFHDSPHTYNPHCTISGTRLNETQQKELEALDISEPFVIDRWAVYSEPLPVEEHFAASLTG